MNRVWDYLMRRKGLLIVILLISAVSSFAISRALSQNHTIPDHTYITIANWGDDSDNVPMVEVPLTGGEASEPFFSVMPPRELAQLPSHKVWTNALPDNVGAESLAPNATSPNTEPTDNGAAENSAVARADTQLAASDPSASDVRSDAMNSPAQVTKSVNPFLFLFYSAALILLTYLTYQHFRR